MALKDFFDAYDKIIEENNNRSDNTIDLKELNYLKLFKLIFPHWYTYVEWVERGKLKEDNYLYPWQEELIKDVFQPLIENYEKDDMQIYIAMAGAYGTGKSKALAIIIVMHVCYCFLYEKHRQYKGSVYSGSEVQLRTTLWDEVRRMSNNNLMLIHQVTKLFVDHKLLTAGDDNDYCVTAETINTENQKSKRGKHGGNVLIVFDEGTNMSERMFDTASTFGTNARHVWLVMSNPDTTIGRFYQLFTNEQLQKIWKTKNISVFDSYPEGHNYAKNQIDQHGEDSDEVRVSVYGLFPQKSLGAIFPKYLLDEAIKRKPVPYGDICCMGIDLATERGRDYSCIAIKRPHSYFFVEKYKMDVTSFIRNVVIPLIMQYRPCFVAMDRGGIGEMPCQELNVFCASYGFKFISVDFGGKPWDNKYLNRRTELIFRVKDRLMDGYSLPANQELVEQMSWLTFGGDYGRIKAVSKKELPQSTDMLDAIAMTEAAELMSPEIAAHERRLRNRVNDYDY